MLRLVGSTGHGADVARAIPQLAGAGITDVVVDIDWSEDVAEQASMLLTATMT